MRESTVSTGQNRHLGASGHAGPGAAGRARLGSPFCSLMFLSVAIWNGFPLIFYDTGAYVLEGLGHVFLVERAPVYAELLFLAGGAFSLWPIVILQALMTSYHDPGSGAGRGAAADACRASVVIGAGLDALHRHRLVCRPGRARHLHAAW